MGKCISKDITEDEMEHNPENFNLQLCEKPLEVVRICYLIYFCLKESARNEELEEILPTRESNADDQPLNAKLLSHKPLLTNINVIETI